MKLCIRQLAFALVHKSVKRPLSYISSIIKTVWCTMYQTLKRKDFLNVKSVFIYILNGHESTYSCM